MTSTSGIILQGETEKRLLKALRQGRQEALSQLYDAYAPVLMGVISRIVPDKELAESVLQETFVAVWSRINLYDAAKSSFLLWGLTIARSMALDMLATSRAAANSEKPAPAGSEDPEEGKLQHLNARQNIPCQLAPQEQLLLELLYLKGCNCTEAAATLGMTEARLKTSIKQVFLHLKAERSA
ncbi:RNA polymerase sigma factor [Pontibacter chitinilyticus]|uniref:RNA polymerase sigma factor n=1 Tax=Pontibacter chitinilyticus TaxID=2674989 RepID=UPI00321B8D2E